MCYHLLAGCRYCTKRSISNVWICQSKHIVNCSRLSPMTNMLHFGENRLLVNMKTSLVGQWFDKILRNARIILSCMWKYSLCCKDYMKAKGHPKVKWGQIFNDVWTAWTATKCTFIIFQHSADPPNRFCKYLFKPFCNIINVRAGIACL